MMLTKGQRWMPCAMLSGPHYRRRDTEVLTDSAGNPPQRVEFLGGALVYLLKGPGKVNTYPNGHAGPVRVVDGAHYDVDPACSIMRDVATELEAAAIEKGATTP